MRDKEGTLGKGSVFSWLEDNATPRELSKISNILRIYKKNISILAETKGANDILRVYHVYTLDKITQAFPREEVRSRVFNIIKRYNKELFPGGIHAHR